MQIDLTPEQADSLRRLLETGSRKGAKSEFWKGLTAPLGPVLDRLREGK